MSVFYWILGAPLCVLALFAVTFYAASEAGGEVVTLRRPAPGVGHSDVRVWIVDDRGVSWIEHGEADSPWIRQLRNSPQLTLVRDGEAHDYLAEPDPAAHARYHRLRQEKYGLADDIIATLTGVAADCPGVPVRLELQVP